MSKQPSEYTRAKAAIEKAGYHNMRQMQHGLESFETYQHNQTGEVIVLACKPNGTPRLFKCIAIGAGVIEWELSK